MALPVSLREVVDTFEMLSDHNSAYLNRRTGEIFVVDEEFSISEDDEDFELEDTPEWQRELIAKAQEIHHNEDWLALPDKFEIHEWNIMDQFCRSITSEPKRKHLMGAIRARGAFGHFRRMIDEFGLVQQWISFRDTTLEEIAVDWLEAHQIPYTREASTKEASSTS